MTVANAKTDRGHIAYARRNKGGSVSFIGWKAKKPKREHVRPKGVIAPGAEMIIKTPDGMNTRLGREFALKVIGKDATHYHVKVTHSTGKTQIGKEYPIEHATLHEAAKTAKVFVPAHEAVVARPGSGQFQPGDKVKFTVSDQGITRRRKGTVVRPLGRDLWVIQGADPGAGSAGEMHAVPTSAILTEEEARRAKNDKYENVGASRNRLTAEEHTRRAEEAAQRTSLTEEQVLVSPAFQNMMHRTVSGLAGSNKIDPGNIRTINGVRMSEDNFEYNDLVSDYMMAATSALRRELSTATPQDVDSFEAHIAGVDGDSRIFRIATKEGRNAVVSALKQRKAHHEQMRYLDEDGAEELADTGNVTPWWEDEDAVASFSPDMHEQLRRIQEREKAIAGLVGTLTPVEQEVVNRKYGLGNVIEPQTSDVIASKLKQKNIPHPTGKDWNREQIKPVHDAAIKRLQQKTDIDTYREFLRALQDHLTMVKSMGAVKILAPGMLVRTAAGRIAVTATGLAKSLSLDNGAGMWVDTEKGARAIIIKKGHDMGTLDELKKGIGLSEELLKSHVKEYTRTTASGATVTVKEHDDKRQKAVASAAKAHLGIEDLGEKGSDRESFKDLHVSRVKEALHAAYRSGGGGRKDTDHLIPIAKKHRLVRGSDFKDRGLDRHDFKESHIGSIKAALEEAHDAGKKEAKAPKKKDEPRIATENDGRGFHGVAHGHAARKEVGIDGDIFRAPQATYDKVQKQADDHFHNAAKHLLKTGHFKTGEEARQFLDSRAGRHLGDAAFDHDMDLAKTPEKQVKSHVKWYKEAK